MVNIKTDAEIIAQFEKQKAWGLACSVDLQDCSAEKITDANAIKEFVVKLCKLIDMKRFGDTVVVNFGDDPKVSGFSMTQLIETSLISGHFVNQTNSAYLDIFSCKRYPPHKMAKFCKEFFGAKKYELNVVYRY